MGTLILFLLCVVFSYYTTLTERDNTEVTPQVR